MNQRLKTILSVILTIVLALCLTKIIEAALEGK